LVAFTSYPADHFATPADIPADYYSRIYDHIKPSDEVMFMELGWPSSGKGTEQEQVEFVKRLPALMKDVKPAVIAWPLLHDVGGVFSADLASTGLYTQKGAPKPAAAAFKQLAAH
jgi:hypothetical protein